MAPANTAAISGQSISSTAFNTLETDIGTEITNSVDRGGRSAMTAALPMGGQKITGMADPTVSTDATTKAYVDATVASFFSTGDVKLTLKVVPDTGWILFDDGSIGSASSGAASRAASDCQALFIIIFNNISDASAPIFTSGGGATTRAAQVSASAAWAANCRINLTKTLGRALGIAGSGSGLTARALGAALGEEAHTLSVTEIPQHTHSGTTSVENAQHTHAGGGSGNGVTYAPNAGSFQGFTPGNTAAESATHAHIFTTDGGTGGGGAHNNMPPITFLNAMVKL